MECERARERLQEARDGARLPGTVESHLDVCAGCSGFRDALLAVDKALATEPVLPWRPELTARILLAARRQTRRTRLFAAAAAAMLLASVWLGAGFVEQAPAIAGLAVPEQPEISVAGLGASATDLVEDAVGLLAGLPIGPGEPVALLGLAGLLALNTIVVRRLRVARRRLS